MKPTMNPYKIVHIYGAWVIFKAELNEDLSPKLRDLVIVDKPHATEQQAELALQKIIEEQKASAKFAPKMCSTCKKVKEQDDFHRMGEKLNYECKLCRSQRPSSKRSRAKSIPVRPNTRGLCETGVDNRKVRT